jgi:4-carboxymuconolactone decarboxylase
LLGPWNRWLHEPSFGKASWDLVRALADKPSLPKSVREVAIVTGAVAGQRPVDLTQDEAIAYDFASALVNGGVLPELTYKTAIVAFGQHGAAELSYLVGLYALVSITLNTFDVPVPEA